MGITVDPKTGNPTGNVPQVLQFQNNFIPAQATSAVQYAANLPTQPNTPASSGAAAGTITAAGGMNPADFASNPLPTAQPFYTDGTAVGAAVNNKLTVPAPITTATLLSGGANSDSLATNFVAGDTIKLTGSAGDVVTFTFVASGATGNQINVTDSVGTSAFQDRRGHRRATRRSPPARSHCIPEPAKIGASAAPAAAFTAANIGFTSPVAVNRTVASTGNGAVIGNDLTTFTNESISGGAVTTYDSAGTPINLQLRWAKTDSASLGTGHKDVWNLFYQTQTAPRPAPSRRGSIPARTSSSPRTVRCPRRPAPPSRIPNVTVNGLSLGNLSFNLSSGALTQFASSSGAATINTITQNGFAAGQLQSVAVNNSGLVVGTFSNGQNIDLAQVTLSHFNGTNYLKALDGGAYEATDLSGPAIIGASGKISGSSLEGSNTDIADEFTKLIVTQQAYSANTKVITTANNMVQDLLNVLR